MANALTGDWEACVQVAVRQLDGLLGTLHQAGGDEGAELKLLHSTSLRIGDPRPFPDVGGFGEWVLEHVRGGPPRRLSDVRAELIAGAPPGMAGVLSEAFEGLFEDRALERTPPPSPTVRGLAKLQLGSVTLSLLKGSTSEVSLHVPVRAHYDPDAGTTQLPAPIHGEVTAAFEVRTVRRSRVDPLRLVVEPSAQDAKITFAAAPGSGLSTADEGSISRQVRKALREGFELVPVDLPAGFPFTAFKGVRKASPIPPPGLSADAIALPLQLSVIESEFEGPRPTPPPASGLSSITRSFVGSSGFAFAVSPDHVKRLVDLEEIRRNVNSQGEVRIDALRLTLRSGAIEIAGDGEALITGPNPDFSFTQALTLVLDAASQAVGLERAGDPSVDLSVGPIPIPDWVLGFVKDRIRREIDDALPAQAPVIAKVFADAKSTLVDGLKTFDAAASASYTAVQITPDGVIVRGDLGSAARAAPAVKIGETQQGAAFTALESWIPAGRIDRLVWSWIEHTGPVGWRGVERSQVEEHRFVLPKPKPPGIGTLGRVCLRIEGTRVGPDGRETAVVAGETCRVREREIGLDAPSWLATLTLPEWRGDIADDATIRDAVAAHVSVQRTGGRAVAPASSALLHFPDWGSERPLEALGAAVAKVPAGAPLVVVAVLPPGAFDASRREIEAKLAWSPDSPVALEITEDHEGGWSATFAVEKRPSTYLLGAAGKAVHSQQGETDPDALAYSLDELLASGAERRLTPGATDPSRALALKVSLGERAPDASFADDQGERGALHRFRRRGVLLNFFQSWSAPCLTELERLQALHADEENPTPVVAFHGGQDANALEALRKELGLTFPLVHDAQHRATRRYGVRCWPTTITVGPDGNVEHIQLGTAHEHGEAEDTAQTKGT